MTSNPVYPLSSGLAFGVHAIHPHGPAFRPRHSCESALDGHGRTTACVARKHREQRVPLGIDLVALVRDKNAARTRAQWVVSTSG